MEGYLGTFECSHFACPFPDAHLPNRMSSGLYFSLGCLSKPFLVVLLSRYLQQHRYPKTVVQGSRWFIQILMGFIPSTVITQFTLPGMSWQSNHTCMFCQLRIVVSYVLSIIFLVCTLCKRKTKQSAPPKTTPFFSKPIKSWNLHLPFLSPCPCSSASVLCAQGWSLHCCVLLLGGNNARNHKAEWGLAGAGVPGSHTGSELPEAWRGKRERENWWGCELTHWPEQADASQKEAPK